MSVKKCGACGAPLNEAARFCEECGAPVQARPGPGKKNTALFAVVGAVVLLIAAAVLAAVLIRGKERPAPVTITTTASAGTTIASTEKRTTGGESAVPLAGLWRTEDDDSVELLELKADGTYSSTYYFRGSGGHINRQFGSYTLDGGALVLFDVTDDQGEALSDIRHSCNYSRESMNLDSERVYFRVAERHAAAVLENPFAAYPEAYYDHDQEVLDFAEECLELIKDKQWGALGSLVHPKQGLTFSPYGYVDGLGQVFGAGDVKALDYHKGTLVWGSYDGSGEPIELTFPEYYKRFIFDHDFTQAPQVEVDKVIKTTMVSNLHVFGNGGAFVEFHFPGTAENAELDWASLRLVFSWDNTQPYLVAVVHDQWTV